jgi:hypothetical protein
MTYLYKSRLLLFSVAIILCALLWPSEAEAQGDTLLVEWWDDDAGAVIVNSLRDAILNDTERPAGRVYKLMRGGYYHITDRIENAGYHLRIVGETPGNTIETAPAVIQRVTPEVGSIDTRIITGLDDVTLVNLWIAGADDQGVQTAYQPVQMDASNARFVFDNVVFERSNFAIPAFTGANNTIIFQNCVFRNLVGKPSDQQWQGRGISVWADQDTVIIENNTFFNISMTAFQLEGGAGTYVRFNHNTLVHIGRGMTSGNWWRTAYFTNNLIINPFWHGEGNADITSPGREPGQVHAGIFGLGSLPTKYGPPEGRRIVFGKNYAWRDQAFIDYYADSIRAQPFISTLSKEYYQNYDQIIAVDTVWMAERPNLGVYPNSELIGRMIANISDLRQGSGDATQHFWMLPTIPGTEELNHIAISWPLPEDFSYTDADLMTAGVNGFPIGDLNWFPARKADWEASKDQNIEAVHALAGKEVIITVEGTAEAEVGTLGGEAEIVEYGGELPYFKMEGGGFISWTFDMEEAATVELIITTRSQDARRGQHVRLNGQTLRNFEGSGEYSWFDLHPTDWKDYHINQDTLIEGAPALELTAGEHTLEISPSWGWQEFLQVQILVGGNVVHTLNAANVTEFDIVQLISPVTLPYFRMEGAGFMRWVFEMNEAASVDLRITTRSQDARRGQHVRVNGTGLINDSGFGEYSWYDLDPEEWKAYLITKADLLNGTDAALDLPAGENTIEIAQSWGWQQFLKVEVLVGDNVVHELTGLNVTEFDIVTLVSEGGPPPSGFKSVDLKGGGSITWVFDVDETETYALNVLYQAPSGTQTATVQVNGVNAGSVLLEGEEGDLTIHPRLSSFFALTTGQHEITLSGSNVIIDLVQLIKAKGEDPSSVGPGQIPYRIALEQNYPNPFNPSTNIQYYIPVTQKVVLKIYNVLGQEIQTLVNEIQTPGTYMRTFDAAHLASGVYFYRLTAGDFVEVKKMLLIK